MKQTNFQVLYDNLLDGKETVSLNSRSVVMYFCTGKFLLHIEIQNILTSPGGPEARPEVDN